MAPPVDTVSVNFWFDWRSFTLIPPEAASIFSMARARVLKWPNTTRSAVIFRPSAARVPRTRTWSAASISATVEGRLRRQALGDQGEIGDDRTDHEAA